MHSPITDAMLRELHTLTDSQHDLSFEAGSYVGIDTLEELRERPVYQAARGTATRIDQLLVALRWHAPVVPYAAP
jgi:hypothetical protein